MAVRWEIFVFMTAWGKNILLPRTSKKIIFLVTTSGKKKKLCLTILANVYGNWFKFSFGKRQSSKKIFLISTGRKIKFLAMTVGKIMAIPIGKNKN